MRRTPALDSARDALDGELFWRELMADVGEVLRAYVIEELMAGRSPDELNENTHLIEEEILDSLGILNFVSHIEESLDVTIEPEEVVLENFRTLGAIRQLVEAKLS